MLPRSNGGSVPNPKLPQRVEEAKQHGGRRMPASAERGWRQHGLLKIYWLPGCECWVQLG